MEKAHLVRSERRNCWLQSRWFPYRNSLALPFLRQEEKGGMYGLCSETAVENKQWKTRDHHECMRTEAGASVSQCEKPTGRKQPPLYSTVVGTPAANNLYETSPLWVWSHLLWVHKKSVRSPFFCWIQFPVPSTHRGLQVTTLLVSLSPR